MSYVDASLAASSANNTALEQNNSTSINFGAGVIEAPNTFTTPQTATPVATSALGSAASNVAPSGASAGGSSLGGFTLTKTQGELIAGAVVLLVVIGIGAYLHSKKILV
jgi:hypothetical protein